MKTSVAICCAVLALAIGASPARAANAHTFNPVLSLTGGTGVSAEDPVADPGAAHPPKPFDGPCGVTTDSAGYIYVASPAIGNGEGTEGRIYVFDPAGNFVVQIKNDKQPCGLAVDSEGNLYVQEFFMTRRIVMYSPDSFPPTPTTDFGSPQVIDEQESLAVAVDPSDDHVYLAQSFRVAEYDSAANGSALLDETHANGLSMRGVDVYGANGDIYGSATRPGGAISNANDSRVYVLDGDDDSVKVEIDGTETPDEGFGFKGTQRASVAVDQTNGDVYVGDIATNGVVHQFRPTPPGGDFVTQIEHSLINAVPTSDIAVDSSPTSPNQGYVYVTSGNKASNGHLYAFAPQELLEPEVENEAVEQVTDTEARLAAELNANGLETSYRFEYGTADCSANPCQSVPVPEADGGSAAAFVPVSQPIAGLQPGTTYHFRLVATNECEPEVACTSAGSGATFTTYPAGEAGLPDGRVYELVTPPDTNGRTPTGAIFGTVSQSGFTTALVAAGGDRLLFGTEGGSLPGLPGGGFYDVFEAVRGPLGWETRFSGLTGAQAAEAFPGGVSADHRFSAWRVTGSNGSLAVGGMAGYVRGPGGDAEPIGRGSLGDDLTASARWIAAGGEHLIFVTGVAVGAKGLQLEPEAAPTGTAAIYDRTPGGPTHVVSLLPGEVPLGAGENAEYLGASADGSSVAFRVGETMYERRDNAQTLEVAEGTLTLAGISGDGNSVFYLEGGDLFIFDAVTETTELIGSGGATTVVNVSADGSHVYFVSPAQLDGGEGEAGEENLYEWDGTEIRFIAVLDPLDVEGEQIGFVRFGGLGQWVTDAVAPSTERLRGPASDPSRTTPDGNVFVFESHANLTPPYDSDGHSQIYRYDATADDLACVSCNPTNAVATADAQLQPPPENPLIPFPPVNAMTPIANVTADGETVVFETAEALVFEDVDAKKDVYRWRDGRISLLSSPHSASDDHLYAVSPSGRDVFFLTADRLLPQDLDSTPSIYDARVGGGQPIPQAPQTCQGEGCKGQPSGEPRLASPGSARLQAPPPRGRRCPKGKRRVRRGGKARCAKKRSPRRRAGKRASRSGRNAR